jgi:hypothetical protein
VRPNPSIKLLFRFQIVDFPVDWERIIWKHPKWNDSMSFRRCQ